MSREPVCREPPQHRRSVLYLISYGMALVGTVISSLIPPSVTLALRIAELDPAGKTASFSIIIGIGTLVMLVATPLAGHLSDASSSRFGLRRPWIWISCIGTLLCAFPLASATSVPGIAVSWAVAAVFISIGFSPLLAVINDQFPASQHGVVSGIAGTAPLLGVLLGSWIVQLLPQTPFYLFVVPAAVAGLLTLQFLILLSDRVQDSESQSFNLGGFLKGFYFNPRSNPPFAWLLVVVALTSVGAVALQNYMVYLLQDSLKIPTALLARTTFLAIFASNAVGAGFSILGGAMSDWLGKRKPVFAAGAALLSIGLVVEVASTTLTPFMVGCVLAGVGFGLVNGLYWALAVQSSGDESNSGRDMGLVSVSLTLPGITIPFIAPLILRSGHGNNYSALYILCAAGTALAIPALTRVRGVS